MTLMMYLPYKNYAYIKEKSAIIDILSATFYRTYLAARLMHKYNAHGATDVTGFGLLGHAQNLAKHQKNEVSFVIHNLPVIAKMAAVAKACGNMFQLLQGHSAETSGGLLICLPREQVSELLRIAEVVSLVERSVLLSIQ